MLRSIAVPLFCTLAISLAGCEIHYTTPAQPPQPPQPAAAVEADTVVPSPVEIFVDYDYGGASARLNEGFTNLGELGIPNDSLSAVRVPRGYRVTLFEHGDGQGRSIVLTENTAVVPSGWNDITSSVFVERVGHPRHRMPGFRGSVSIHH